MTEVFSELSKPTWWVTVFIAGLAINIIAAYIKPLIDRMSQRFSNKSRVRLQRYLAHRQSRIESLLDDQIAFANLKLDGIYSYLVFLGTTLVFMLFIFTGNKLAFAIGGITIVIGKGIALIILLLFLFYEIRIFIDAELTIRAVRRERLKRESKNG